MLDVNCVSAEHVIGNEHRLIVDADDSSRVETKRHKINLRQS